MMLLLALGLILLGVMLGAAGLRRAGPLTMHMVRPWRPAVGALALIALFGGAIVAARGALAEGAALAALGLALAVGARKRRREAIGSGPVVSAAAMTEAQARQMLGVSSTADTQEIEAAYRRLMKLVHPDHGGAAGLAAQLNAARAALRG